MALRWRPMQRNDVRPCAEIVASHATIGARYGRAVKDVEVAWLRLLGSQAMRTAIFEEVDHGAARILGVGVSVLVSDDFMREVKTAPLFWFGPELAKRISRGSSPVLSDRQVREANSGEGLNVLVWEAIPRSGIAQQSDFYHLMVSAYVEIHRGFFLKEMITSQSESVERLQWAIDAGGLYWDPKNARYEKSLPASPAEFIRKPHIVGITRELELRRPGSWIGVLFNYHAPRFGFCPSEQRLLLTALGAESGTDQELANAVGVSIPRIKKTWLSVYNRVAECQPKLIPDQGHLDAGARERGPEKRRRLLSYLREHPEELRPISRKRFRRGAAPNLPSN